MTTAEPAPSIGGRLDRLPWGRQHTVNAPAGAHLPGQIPSFYIGGNLGAVVGRLTMSGYLDRLGRHRAAFVLANGFGTAAWTSGLPDLHRTVFPTHLRGAGVVVGSSGAVGRSRPHRGDHRCPRPHRRDHRVSRRGHPMPREEHIAVPLTDLVLTDPAGRPVHLADLPGVQVVVLMRHRH